MKPIALILLCALQAAAQTPLGDWPQHYKDRPTPPIVMPGTGTVGMTPPAGAVVLFDGKNLDQWEHDKGPAAWKVEGGAFQVVPGTGTLHTKAAFGDAQVHIEWASPKPAKGSDQDRGNSGVFPMGRYEVQVLDSYENVTYADGQAGAIYGQFPPLVNASRPPGEWQSYDIIFHRPRWDAAGKLTSPARMTVLHNGILVQDNIELVGPTSHMRRAPYEKHADRLPLALQDHEHPVRFRNVWVIDLEKR